MLRFRIVVLMSLLLAGCGPKEEVWIDEARACVRLGDGIVDFEVRYDCGLPDDELSCKVTDKGDYLLLTSHLVRSTGGDPPLPMCYPVGPTSCSIELYESSPTTVHYGPDVWSLDPGSEDPAPMRICSSD